MKITPLVYFPALLCLVFNVVTAQSTLRKIYLQPKTVAREKQTRFLDSLHFIPLEVKQGVQIFDNYYINVTDKLLLLSDYLNKRLVLYLRNGKYITTINYSKLGNGYYPAYDELNNKVMFNGGNKSYSLTRKDEIKIKLDWDNPKNRKYYRKYSVDLNDSLYTLKKDVVTKQDILGVGKFYDDYYMQTQISTSDLYKDSIDYEIKLYRKDKLVKTYFPYNRINDPRYLFTTENVGVARTDTPYVHIISRPYNDTLYKMVGDSLFAYSKVVLPLENTLPASFFTKAPRNETERDNFKRNNGWMLRQIYNYYENLNLILFSASYLSNFESYVYDKRTDITYKSKNIRSDSSQYELQLLGGFNLPVRRGNRFYSTQKASNIIAFFDKNKNVPVPTELQAFLSSKPPANTPVIVEFKFKN